MDRPDVASLLGVLALALGAAKLLGGLARRIGQPAVLGELMAGVILGASAVGLVDPEAAATQALAEIGVVILLFAIGLETDLGELVRVGGASAAVAIAGVILPFGMGYAACRLLGVGDLAAIMVGASLTATSVGITARVLSDLGRLREPEGRVILGAAVLDDVIGLVILTLVAGLARGQAVTAAGVATAAGIAFGFLLATVVLGRLMVPALLRLVRGSDLPGVLTVLPLMLAFGSAWLADHAGSARIIGAFAAGLMLARSPQAHEIERRVTVLGHFFVPLFFVAVGASVDVRVLNPIDPSNRPTWLLGGLLILAAVAGKLLAGYAPFWFRGRKSLIGVGMIPRGEVGLIFAQLGLAGGIFDDRIFGAVMVMVAVTTFIAPPLLKWLLAASPDAREPIQPEGIEELATNA
jgi:Na+:H+ antiporter